MILDLPPLKRIDGPIRVYETPEGHRYPSITTILSAGENKALDDWRARVGVEEAKKITARATSRGTRIHSLCEAYLKGEPVNPGMFDREAWKSFKLLVEKISNPILIEGMLYSNYLKVAGTVDCIGYWEGKLSVIDFKTSSATKKEEWIHSYFMQESAYAVCFEEQTKQPITQLVTLISVDDAEPQVFIQHRNSWIGKFIEKRKQFEKEHGI